MQGYTLEEQRYKIALYIRQQPQRNALFITPEAEKFAIVVPDLPDFPSFEEMDEEIESFKLRTFQRSQFANPTASVVREIKARRERLLPPDSPEERENW